MDPNPINIPHGIVTIDDGRMPEARLIDREQAFLLYASFCGDVVKTGHSLGISPIAVVRMADECDWNEKLKPILELKNSTRPGDLERAINRAVNFVQAHRLRILLERTLKRLTDLSPSDLENYLQDTKTDKEGKVVSVKLCTRALTDFAKAMESAHGMIYMALGDTASERVKRKEEDAGGSATVDLHTKLAAAMAQVASNDSFRAKVFDDQLKEADIKRVVEVKAKVEASAPMNPNDSDDH